MAWCTRKLLGECVVPKYQFKIVRWEAAVREKASAERESLNAVTVPKEQPIVLTICDFQRPRYGRLSRSDAVMID